jgi:hypothetical protein
LTSKIQKGLFCLKSPLFQEKNWPKFWGKSIYWESLATFPHSFNCQGSFFLTVFYKLANWCFFLLLEWLLMMLHKKTGNKSTDCYCYIPKPANWKNSRN